MPPLAPTTTPSGEYVRKMRTALGENQSQFAERLGVRQPTISRIEGGSRPLSADFAFRLVTRLGVDARDVERYVDDPGYFGSLLSGVVSTGASALEGAA